MTKDEKNKVLALQESGKKPVEIATELNLPYNTVKSYLRRSKVVQEDKEVKIVEDARDKTKCLCCGMVLNVVVGKKEKKFCSDRCRLKYWREHHGK